MNTQAKPDVVLTNDPLTAIVKAGLCRCWLQHIAQELDAIRLALDDNDAGRKAITKAHRQLRWLDETMNTLADVLVPTWR